MTETISGYRIKKRKGLNHWHPLMEEFLLAIERYNRVMGGEDSIYLYTERACVGALAGAAWRCGMVALEEFQFEKSSDKKDKYSGRADLYFASDRSEDFVEAKFGWVSLRPNRALEDLFSERLNAALIDTEASRKDDEESTFSGIAFCPVYVTKTAETAEDQQIIIDQLIHSAISAAENCEAHVYGWCFPKETRGFLWGDNYVNPGVIFLASNLRHVTAKRAA